MISIRNTSGDLDINYLVTMSRLFSLQYSFLIHLSLCMDLILFYLDFYIIGLNVHEKKRGSCYKLGQLRIHHQQRNPYPEGNSDFINGHKFSIEIG